MNFVPQNIGRNHLKLDDFLKHNTKIAKCLLNLGADTFAVIADGTYCYIQRVTYSGQKKRHLVKPFVICCTDRYIIDIFGLYPGTQNDASIMLDILDSDCLSRLLKDC